MRKVIASFVILFSLFLLTTSAQANTVPSYKCSAQYERLLNKYHKGFDYYSNHKNNRIVYNRLYKKGCLYSPDPNVKINKPNRKLCKVIATDSSVYLTNVADRVKFDYIKSRMNRFSFVRKRSENYKAALKVRLIRAKAGWKNVGTPKEIHTLIRKTNRNIHKAIKRFDRHQALLVVRLKPYSFHIDLNTLKAISSRCVDMNDTINGIIRGPVSKVLYRNQEILSYSSAALWGRYDYYYPG